MNNVDELIRAIVRQVALDYLTGGCLGQDAAIWLKSPDAELFCAVTRLDVSVYARIRSRHKSARLRRMIADNRGTLDA